MNKSIKTLSPTTWSQYKRLLKQRRKRRLKAKGVKYCLYVLELEDDYWYVGTSRNYQRRYIKHCNGTGARWTAKHKPLRFHEIRELGVISQREALKLEDQVTLEYAALYGELNVRGGSWCGVIYPNYPKQ